MNDDNDNLENANDDDVAAERDWLAERLRREALAERPPFSPQLHETIRQRLAAGDSRRPRTLVLRLPSRAAIFTAAAAAAIVLAVTIAWLSLQPRTLRPPLAGRASPQPRSADQSVAFDPAAVDAAASGVTRLLQRRWPSRVVIPLPAPLADLSNQAEYSESPSRAQAATAGSQRITLARFRLGTSQPQAQLSITIPPEVSTLIELTRIGQSQFHSASELH